MVSSRGFDSLSNAFSVSKFRANNFFMVFLNLIDFFIEFEVSQSCQHHRNLFDVLWRLKEASILFQIVHGFFKFRQVIIFNQIKLFIHFELPEICEYHRNLLNVLWYFKEDSILFQMLLRFLNSDK